MIEKVVLGKQASDLCTSTLTQYFVHEYFAEGSWREYVEDLCGIYRERRDAMLDALEQHSPRDATWSRPEGGLFLWATLPDYINTTDLLAKALRDNVAFVPGAAAYVDGRGRSSMRLNFSASPRRRSTRGSGGSAGSSPSRSSSSTSITGEHPTTAVSAADSAPGPGRTGRRPDRAGRPVSAQVRMKVAVLKGGRGLERQVSLRSGARVEDALASLGHEVVAIDVGSDLMTR